MNIQLALCSFILCAAANGTGAYFQPAPESAAKRQFAQDRELILEPYGNLKMVLEEAGRDQADSKKISEAAKTLCDVLEKSVTLRNSYWLREENRHSIVFSHALSVRGVVLGLLSSAEPSCDEQTRQRIDRVRSSFPG